jgi:superfamily II DNA or RNA helicase
MSTPAPLFALIAVILAKHPGLTARELAARLGESKSTVNSVLYSRRDLFFRSADSRPQWWLQSVDDEEIDVGKVDASDLASGDLFQWQREALLKWAENGNRGVVEAVTGSGKTRVGLAAARHHVDGGGKVAVIVPSIPLLEQWTSQIEHWIPGAIVGRRGGGGADDLGSVDVLVAVDRSAARHSLGLPDGYTGLLVADECHHYGADVNQLALQHEFECRLGLTATYERSDGRHESVLDPYFGGVVYVYGYADAVAQRVVAPFRVALLPVSFSDDEREEYEALTAAMRKAKQNLVALGAPAEPFQEFIQYVTALSKSGARHEGIAAGRYLGAMSSRGDLLADADAKYQALRLLADAMAAAGRTIVFTETIDSTETCAALIGSGGIAAEALHSGIPMPERTAMLGRFADGTTRTIVAPRLLDEGVDVPEADLGVIVAASRQRRQMVQRMGRILRRKSDGRAARFVIIFIEGTVEDPANEAHETFLNEILDVADDIKRFPAGKGRKKISKFLAP